MLLRNFIKIPDILMSTSAARSIHVLEKKNVKKQKDCRHNYHCLYVYDGEKWWLKNKEEGGFNYHSISTGWNSRFGLWCYCGIRNPCSILSEIRLCRYGVYKWINLLLESTETSENTSLLGIYVLANLISLDFAVSFFSRSTIFSTLSICKAKPQM